MNPLPEPGTKAWIREMRKALASPNYHIKINVDACRIGCAPAVNNGKLDFTQRAQLFLLTEAKNK